MDTSIGFDPDLSHSDILARTGLPKREMTVGHGFTKIACSDAGMWMVKPNKQKATFYWGTGKLMPMNLDGSPIYRIDENDPFAHLDALERYRSELEVVRQTTAVLFLGALEALAQEDPRFGDYSVWWTVSEYPEEAFQVIQSP